MTDGVGFRIAPTLDFEKIPSASEALKRVDATPAKVLHGKVRRQALKTCLAAISRAVRLKMTSTVAYVPTFAFGEPLSHVDDITGHVKTVLELRGYHVTAYPNCNAVAITWTEAAPSTQPDADACSSRDRDRDLRVVDRSHEDERDYDVGL